MPTMVSSNTNAACIMIGEKCADLLKDHAAAVFPPPSTPGRAMKIDDVGLTLFAWDDIPATRYALGSANLWAIRPLAC